MNHQPESSIAAHEAAVRHQQRVWGLGLLFVGLHIGYVAFPLLPVAGTQAWLPWMALLPPLFACGYAVVMLGMLRRWRRTRATDHTFIAIPAPDERNA
jgi:cation transport ATPase